MVFVKNAIIKIKLSGKKQFDFTVSLPAPANAPFFCVPGIR
jgi:hypothetical protein